VDVKTFGGTELEDGVKWMYRKTCMLCQRTSQKRWFGNRTMTLPLYCAVLTNAAVAVYTRLHRLCLF